MTKQSVAAENYPFCTIDPSEARCPVPDQRFQYLVDLWKSPSNIPAALSVLDIAGIIKGASTGAGLGNAFLSHIAAVDGIFHVVRAFDNDAVVHVDDSVDPIRDLETIQGELCLKDLATLEANKAQELDAIRKEKGLAKAATVPVPEVLESAYNKCKAVSSLFYIVLLYFFRKPTVPPQKNNTCTPFDLPSFLCSHDIQSIPHLIPPLRTTTATFQKISAPRVKDEHCQRRLHQRRG